MSIAKAVISGTVYRNPEKRFTGNVTAKSEFINPQELVGFENHSGLTYIKEGTTHLATTIIGKVTTERIKLKVQEKETFSALIYMVQYSLKIHILLII